MPSARVNERNRQLKLTFLPSPNTSPTTDSISPAAMRQTSSGKKSKPSGAARRAQDRTSRRTKSHISSEDEILAKTEKSMRLGLPVETAPYGMFGGSHSDVTSSESDDEPTTVAATPHKRRRQAGSDSDSDKGKSTISVKSKARQRRTRSIVDISDEKEDLRPSKKRRKPTRQRNSNRDSFASTSSCCTTQNLVREEIMQHAKQDDHTEPDSENDIREDLDFLNSSPLLPRGRLRSTQEKPKNARQIALDTLKKRRASAGIPPCSASLKRRKAIILESESDSDLEIVKQESDAGSATSRRDETQDSEGEDESGTYSMNASDIFQERQEDVDFIDNEEVLIGESSAQVDVDEWRLIQQLVSAKSKDVFKYAVEWMVMKRIHPGFNSNAHTYQVIFRKLYVEMEGLVDSKFTSAAWTLNFTRSVKARPNLEISEVSSAMKQVLSAHCEACNRTNHVASFEVRLTGAPYDENTLEPLAAEKSDDEDDDDSTSSSSDPDSSSASDTNGNGERVEYNADGEALPSEDHRFLLGSTCKANAQVAHALRHWRYHLYQWVKQYLENNGHLTAEKLVERDGWSDRKRHKAARKIVNRMERNGEVRTLYKLYREQFDFALEVCNDRENGRDRRR